MAAAEHRALRQVTAGDRSLDLQRHVHTIPAGFEPRKDHEVATWVELVDLGSPRLAVVWIERFRVIEPDWRPHVQVPVLRF